MIFHLDLNQLSLRILDFRPLSREKEREREKDCYGMGAHYRSDGKTENQVCASTRTRVSR